MVWRIQTTWFLSWKLSPNLLAITHHSRISHPFGYFDFWLFWLLVLISCCSKLIAVFIASGTELPHCVQWPYPFRRQDVCDKGWKVVPVHWGSFPVEWVVLLGLHVITLLLYWSTIDLQHCVSFRCTAKWFSFICVWVCVCCAVLTQSYQTLCDLKDCSLPGSSVHGIFQARILDWVAISYSRNIFPT